MIKLSILALALAACTETSAPDPAPDAQSAIVTLPSCASLGCASSFCTSTGDCRCMGQACTL